MVTKNDRDKLNWLIWFFIAVLFVALFFHFCIPEAQGQTPPMNPVTYEWQVDPLGVYLNTLDTYRVLQQQGNMRRLVFHACDTTGGQSIADDDSAYITLDKEVVEANIYVHATDDYAVGIAEDGTYEISYHVNSSTSSGTSGMITSLCHYTSSWLNVRGVTVENPANSVANGSTSASTIMLLSAGDSLAIKVKHNGLGVDNLVTVANGVGLTVKKLY